MTMDEVVIAFKTVRDAWNLEIHPMRERDLLNVWWRYLHDLDAAAVMRAVDRFVISGQRYAPRPGELRRETIDEETEGAAPSPEEAWSEFLDVRQAWATGSLPPSTTHAAVLATVKLLGRGGQSLSGASPMDRSYFIDAYKRARVEFDQDRYGLDDE